MYSLDIFLSLFGTSYNAIHYLEPVTMLVLFINILLVVPTVL